MRTATAYAELKRRFSETFSRYFGIAPEVKYCEVVGHLDNVLYIDCFNKYNDVKRRYVCNLETGEIGVIEDKQVETDK